MAAAAALPADIRHVILDRDGVLNQEAPDDGYILKPSDFRWLPGSLEALVALHELGLRISVATNQSPVGRGLMSAAELDEILATMLTQSEAAGGRISGVYFCPHAPDALCDCRKPAPGMIRAAVQDSDIPAAQTVLVGDNVSDVEAARAAGVAAVLVKTGKGARSLAQLRERGELVPVFDDLAQFTRSLTNRSHS